MYTYKIEIADQTFHFKTPIPYLAAAWHFAGRLASQKGTDLKHVSIFLDDQPIPLDKKELRRFSKSYESMLLNPTIKIPSLTTAEKFEKSLK